MRSATVGTLLISLLVSSGCIAATASREEPTNGPTVVLLHGLARTTSSMQRMESALQEAGFRVCNIAYPSRDHSVAELASQHVAPRISECASDPDEPIHFVTHSLGGIVVRQLASTERVWTFGRVVMLGPPNHGSEVVDAIGDWRVFGAVSGPAGGELGTATDALPQRLGPVPFEAGIIAGSSSINWINSAIIPGEDDGKVSIDSAKVEGMRDFVLVATSHPFLMADDAVIEQTLRFLTTGCFAHEVQEASVPGIQPCSPVEAPP